MEIIRAGNFSFELDLTKPLYEQVLQQIRYAVARGEVALGTKLPSVRELAQQLRINPNTVMRAYQELDRDHLTETRRGQGTFITSDQDRVKEIRRSLAGEALQEFIRSMKELGIDRQIALSLIEEGDWT
ncbi:GntR family transcriptional regulator [Desulfitobacterium sp. AusDCA]|uniref:GntR family transcriptional regulator n=1 Tax=Desulfitobacterium sp. AusDCA TaxID=3240383 RepID=UPI003DA73A0A